MSANNNKWSSSRLFLLSFAGLLLLLLSLGACSPENQAEPSPEAQSTQSPPAATLRPTFTPGTPTSTSTPTNTPTPVYTPTPIYTPTPVYTPTPASPPAAHTPAPANINVPVHVPVKVLTHPENVNPLTGLEVSNPALLQRRPLMVRVGNDPEVRPQTGLAKADVIYEDIMDGYWVTRLSAIYLAEDPPIIGPVRSARLNSLLLAPQYDAALIHSGASDVIRWELSQSSITNLDEYFNQKAYFYDMNKDWRGRLFTSAPTVRQYMRDKGLESAARLRGFVFSAEVQQTAVVTTATSITIPYPKKTSPVQWKYDNASGRYLRWVLGLPHTDAADGKQLSAANVILYYAEHQATDIVEDEKGATSIRIVVTGQGPARIFRDGVEMQGAWRTDGSQTPEFIDATGAPLPLKPGNSWIEIVPPDFGVEVSP
jgi:hypothetical protein